MGEMSLNRTLSFIGGPAFRAAFVALVVAIFAVRRRWWSAAMLVTATGGMGAINSALKVMIQRERPAGLPGRKQADGYSFPSGHSSGSAVLLGALGYLAWTKTRHRIIATVVLSCASVLAGFIGRSRVGLQAHYRSDVVAGLVAGAIWLLLVVRLFARRLRREYR